MTSRLSAAMGRRPRPDTSQVAVQGIDTVEGHRASKLKLTMKDHTERHVWVDATNFLELKMDGDPRKLDGRMHNVAVYFRDYHAESGLVVPHMLETVVAGVKQTHQMTVQHVTVNQNVDDSLFAKPRLAMVKVPAQ
ncbi:hypothetical protein OKW41_004797 [Paraburkholderia sp. UCT70]